MDTNKANLKFNAMTNTDLMRLKASIGGKAFYKAVKIGRTYAGALSAVAAISYCVAKGIL